MRNVSVGEPPRCPRRALGSEGLRAARRQVHQLNTLLNQLPARQREALYLRYHQQLDIDEIARLMQINPQSASNLLHRGIKHIREVWVGEIHTFALLLCVYF